MECEMFLIDDLIEYKDIFKSLNYSLINKFIYIL